MSTESPSEYYARIAYGQYMVAVRLADEASDDCGPIEAARVAARVAEAARLTVVYADGADGAPSKRARKYAHAALELSAVAANTAMIALRLEGGNDDTGS
jgi:hypothetical protein